MPERAVLVALGDFDDDFPGRDADGAFPGRVEEPAGVAGGAVSRAIAEALVLPGGERGVGGLVVVAVGADDIDAAGSRPARGGVDDGEFERGRVYALRDARRAGLVGAGGRVDEGFGGGIDFGRALVMRVRRDGTRGAMEQEDREGGSQRDAARMVHRNGTAVMGTERRRHGFELSADSGASVVELGKRHRV